MARFAALPVGRLVELRAGTTRVVVAPECGARLLRFDVADTPILRPAPTRLEGLRPYDYAGFPLLPYSGPIFGGGFAFGSARYGLSRNVSPEADATHGDGWIRPWHVTRESATQLTLAFDQLPVSGGFPFAWRAELTYSVAPGRLAVSMTLGNRDLRPMPAGFGFHPYFARSPGAVLGFQHGKVWPPDSPEAVGIGPFDPPAGLDFNAGQGLDGLVADRCFDGWDGLAILRTGETEVRLTAEPVFGKLQLYVPWYDPYVCVEPVSNANDGFNGAARGVPGHGVVLLEPGEALSGSLAIAASHRGEGGGIGSDDVR